MMDSFSESKLSLLYPVLAVRARLLFDRVIAQGFTFRISQGLRTWEEQDVLYYQMPKVTKARGGWSAHNFGYAFDIVPDDPNIPGFQCDWNILHPSWKMILSLAPDCSLAEGAQWRSFPDTPHFYLKELPATPTNEMRTAYQIAGMAAVWKIFDGIVQQDT